MIEIYDFLKPLFKFRTWPELLVQVLQSSYLRRSFKRILYLCLHYKFAAELQAAWLPLTTSSTYCLILY